MNRKHLAPLIFALLIPILLVVFVGIEIWSKKSIEPTRYNFLYISRSYSDFDTYSVVGNKLKIVPETAPMTSFPDLTTSSIDSAAPVPYKGDATRFYIYNAKNQLSKLISKTEALSLTLNSDAESPDGFTVKYIDESRHSGGLIPMFFYSAPYKYGFHLVKGNSKLPITLEAYDSDFEFVGWIEN